MINKKPNSQNKIFVHMNKCGTRLRFYTQTIQSIDIYVSEDSKILKFYYNTCFAINHYFDEFVDLNPENALYSAY